MNIRLRACLITEGQIRVWTALNCRVAFAPTGHANPIRAILSDCPFDGIFERLGGKSCTGRHGKPKGSLSSKCLLHDISICPYAFVYTHPQPAKHYSGNPVIHCQINQACGTIITLPSSACTSNQIEVITRSWDMIKVMDLANPFHNPLQDKQA